MSDWFENQRWEVKRFLSEILRRGSESAVGEGWWGERSGRWGGEGGGGWGAGGGQGGRGGGGVGGGGGGGGERWLLLAFLLFHYHSGRHAENRTISNFLSKESDDLHARTFIVKNNKKNVFSKGRMAAPNRMNFRKNMIIFNI